MELNIKSFAMGVAVLAAGLTLASCDDKEYDLNLPENKLLTEINIAVDPELPLLVGTDSALVWSKAPENADISDVLWKSSNELVATVSPDGVISAHSLGKATITVTPSCGFGTEATTKSVTVTVIPEVFKVTKIEFLNTETSLYVDDQMKLQTKLYPVNHTYSHLIWSSSNNEVATVDAEGNVTGMSPGEVDIIAATHDGGNCKGIYHLTVMKSEPALDVNILPYNEVLYYKQQLNLDIVTVPETATRATISWSSDDESVLTVENGVVTARNFGTATITATCSNGKSSSITLTVDPGFYVWDATTAFEGWTINNNLGKINIKDGIMECTVTEDANKRIYIQRCYSTAKNQMDLNFDKYPIIALVCDTEVASATFAINLANIGNSVNVNKNLTKVDLGNGKTLMYYDGSDLSSMSNDEGLVPIRAFMFKITKSPVPTFNIHWVRVFESINQMTEFANK